MDGHELTRRQVIGAVGAGGIAFLVGGVRPGRVLDAGTDEAVAATCVMTPAKTEGPYFVDERLKRSDVREDQQGARLALTMYVFDANRDCAPVRGAQVDIWHANASGKYSDESANGTSGQTWLRGYQVTDADGKVMFTTIYPGWYSGRAVHVHFKVRTYDGSAETLEFTSQMFFTDQMNDMVYAQPPYSSRGNPDTTDGRDSIYGGDSVLLLHPSSDGAGGYTADFSVGVSGATTSGSGTTNGTATSGGDTASGGSSAGGALDASVTPVTVVRTASGLRRLHVRVRAGEPVSLSGRLTRARRTLLALRARRLGAGTRTIAISVPAHVKPGAATVRLTLVDASGNAKVVTRTVHLPRVRRG